MHGRILPAAENGRRPQDLFADECHWRRRSCSVFSGHRLQNSGPNGCFDSLHMELKAQFLKVCLAASSLFLILACLSARFFLIGFPCRLCQMILRAGGSACIGPGAARPELRSSFSLPRAAFTPQALGAAKLPVLRQMLIMPVTKVEPVLPHESVLFRARFGHRR